MKIFFTCIRAISYQQVFLLLFVLIACSSSNNLQAQPCDGSTNTCSIVTNFGWTGTAPSSTCGAWVNCITPPSGAYGAVTVAANTYYDFQLSTAGQNGPALYFNGTCGDGTSVSGWNSGSATSVNVGCERTTAINCGSWSSTSSATIQYRYSTPTVALASGPAYSTTAASVCKGYVAAYTATVTNVNSSNAAAYSWSVSNTAVAAIANATTASPTVTFSATGTCTVSCKVTNGSCTATATSSIVTVVAQPALATVNVASPVTGTTICVGYNGPSSTFNAGSGGVSGADAYQYSITGPSGTFSSYTAGTNINTSGGSTSVIIQAERTATTTGTGCTAIGWTTLVTLPIAAQPAVTITSDNNTQGTSLCADITAGTTLTTVTNTGGTGTQSWQWQIYDTLTSAWVNVSGATSSSLNPNTLTTSNTGSFYNGWSNYNPAEIRLQDIWNGLGCSTASSPPTYVAPYPEAFTTNGPTITGCGQATITPVQYDPTGSNYTFYFYKGSYSSGTYQSAGTNYQITSGTNQGYYTTYVDSKTGCNSLNDASNSNNHVSVTVTVAPSTSTVGINGSNYNGYGVGCSGGSNGTVTTTVTGGTANYTYAWSNGITNTAISSNSNTITGLSAGKYHVTITDANNCVLVDSITLSSPSALTVSTTPTLYPATTGYGVNCNGASDGSATAAATGYSGDTYSYSWTPAGYTGATTATYSNLPAGTYTVKATDANSCTATATAVITQPAPITFTYVVSYVCNSTGYTSATITVVPSGGASGTYQVENNGTWGSTGSFSLTGLANGSNNVIYVRDAAYNSCVSASQTVTITFPSSNASSSNCNFWYVAPTGGGTLGTNTCPTSLTYALANASSTRNVILMESGTYNISGTVTIPVPSGGGYVVIDGGYNVDGSNNWYKSTATPTILAITPSATVVTPSGAPSVNAYIGINAASGANNFELKDLTIQVLSGGTTGNYNGYGNSIYGIYLNGQTGYLISRCAISTGAAGTGSSGGTPSGSGGGYGGGAGGVSNSTYGWGYNCGTGCSQTAGAGQNGGTGSGPYGGGGGGSGGSAGSSGGCNSAGCNSSSGNGGNGGNGNPGNSAPAYAGQPTPNGTSNGYLSYFVPVTGSQGYSGDGGGGGGSGGGGSTGGCCTCSCGCGADYGSAGGAGANGGAGGYGGQGGGGSFATYIYGGSGGTFLNCTFSAGAGGAAGSGGTGQAGGSIGYGGGQNDAGGCNNAIGGSGGNGGAGGQGGTGQSGMTGPSYGAPTSGYNLLNGATVTVTSSGIPSDGGTVSAYWFAGCPNSEITISKTTSDTWNFVGSNPAYEDNLTSSSSSYTNSSNTAVIYYTSGSGDQNITTSTTAFNNFIRLIGTRLVPTGSYIGAITAPCPTGTLSLTTSGLSSYVSAGDITGYSWQVSDAAAPSVIVASSTSASPSISAPSGGWLSGHTYQVSLKLQEFCCGWSIPMWSSFTVSSLAGTVAFTADPTTVCNGSTQTYTISAGSPIASTYTWTVTGGTITANSGTSYTANVTSITVIWSTPGAGTVSVTPQNGCGVASTPTVVNVTVYSNPNPSINSAPVGATICSGSPDTLTAEATAGSGGNGSFSYLWSSNAGSSANQIVIESPSGITTYNVTVSDGGSGCSASASQIVTVVSQPSLTAPTPASQAVCAGGAIGAISTSESGGTGTLTYQWYSNTTASTTGGTALSSSNSTSYTPPATSTLGTTYYYAKVTASVSGCNTATTPVTASVAVVAAPSLAAPTPASQSVCTSGLPVSINSSESGGAGALTYQWYSNTSASTTGGTSLGSANGAQSQTYAPPATSVTGTTYYYLIVTASGSGCGTATSPSTASITVAAQPLVPAPTPASQTVCTSGTLGAISVSPTNGTGAYTYQWYSNTSNANSGGTSLGSSNGAQTASYTPPASSTTGTTFYYCVVGSTGTGCNASTSSLNDASVAIVAQPSLTNPTPASQTVCNNAAITPVSSTESGGTGTLTYQWYSNTSNTTTGGTSLGSANGGQTNTYSPPAGTTVGTTYYYLTVGASGTGCSLAKTATTASVAINPVISSYGTVSASGGLSQTLCTNVAPVGPLVVSGATGGTGSFSYLWYYKSGIISAPSGSSTSGWTACTSAQGSGYASNSFTPSGVASTLTFACFVTSVGPPVCDSGQWATNDVQITILSSGPTASTSGGTPICLGGTETLTSTLTPSVTATYQWRVSTDNSHFTNVATGGRSATYSPPSNAIGTFYYDVIDTFAGSGCSPATSNSQTVTVDSQLVTGNPAPATQIVCAGNTPTAITVTPTGGAGTIGYQWYSNTSNTTSGGTLISGANSTSYSPPHSTGGTTYYYLVTTVSGSGCTSPVTSLSDAKVIVSTLTVSAADNNGGNAYCASGTIGLTATPSPAGTYTYSWSSNPAGFTSSLQNPSLPAQTFQSQSPVFTVSVTDGNCTATASTSESVYPTLVLSAALANCMFEDSAHINVSVDSDLVIVTASGGVATYSFGTPPAGSFIRDVVTTSKHMYTVPSSHGIYNYNITDAVGCTATSNNVQALNGNPTNIPYTVVNGSETLTCYDNAYGKWLTFNDTLNNAVLELYDSSQNLGQVSVTVYKDKTSMHIQESGGTCGLAYNYESPLQRHFVIHSTATQPFANQVKLRLYFSDVELDSIEQAEAANYNGSLCSELGSVKSLNDLYITKYDDPRANAPTEDSLYTNNLPGSAGGIYKVYGTATPYSAYVNGPLLKDSLGFNAIYPGSQANHIHYVQLSVTEFSELWLNGAQYYAEPLPVNMLYLQAEGIDNTYIQVSWATAQEINNNHFTVERSTDSQNWDSIGIVLGNGTTTTESDYTFNDNEVVPNINYYYRLKQVDNNGNSTLTEVVTAKILGQSAFNIKGFIPNPTSGNTSLIITTSQIADISVQVFNTLGQDVTAAKSHHLTVGANQLDFDFRSLASGTYTAVITSGNDIYTKRLVITK